MATNWKKLEQLAGTQYGYFTAKQAWSCGFPKDMQSYHCKAGNWQKIDKGLYHLGEATNSAVADFTRVCLWSRNQKEQIQGIISHYSALAFHGYAEYDPTRIHLTVPESFRKRVPDGLTIHKAGINLSAIESGESFLVTRLAQTLADLRAELTASGQWAGLVVQARDAGQLSAEEVKWLESVSAPLVPEPARTAPLQLISREVCQPNMEYRPEPMAGAVLDGASAPAEVGLMTNETQPIDNATMKGVWQMIFERTQRSPRRAQAGFTLVELLVVIAIISILAGMLLPALSRVLENGYKISCANTLNQYGRGLLLYVESNNDFMPPGLMTPDQGYFSWVWWPEFLYPSMGVDLLPNHWQATGNHWKRYTWPMLCPAKEAKDFVQTINDLSYVRNNQQLPYYKSLKYGLNLSNRPIPALSRTSIIMDGEDQLNKINQTGPTKEESLKFRHLSQANVLFLDAHIGGIFNPNFSGLGANYYVSGSGTYSDQWAAFWGCN